MSMPPPRDLSLPPGDMATSPRDMAMTTGDMAMTTGDMAMGPRDMAMGPVDMAMGPVDMAMGPRDMAMGPVDMAMGPVDMAMGPVDMAMGPRDMAASGDMAKVYTCRGPDAPGTVYQLVSDTLTLPTGPVPFNYDYDGSGKMKNGLKTLVQTVALAGLSLQPAIDDAVKKGSALQLSSFTTTDLMTSSCAGVSVIPAKSAATPPKFDGTDMLEKAATMPAELIGTLATGKLQTKASKSLAMTEDGILELQLPVGATALSLPIHGVHLEGTVEKMGAVTRIKNGVLHGVISQADIDAKIFPGIATLVTGLINSDPMSMTTKTIIALLETMSPVSMMKCMMPTMCCKTNPATCVILPAEVKMSLIGAVIKSDVQVFDAMGRWSPVSGGTSPNGMTVGIGFTAVSATYP